MIKSKGALLFTACYCKIKQYRPETYALVVHENIPADSFEATVLLTESPEPHCPRPRRTKGAGEPGPARAQQTVMAHNGLPSLPKWTGAM